MGRAQSRGPLSAGTAQNKLWTGAILHASHNLYIQGIFTPLTRNTGKTAWYIDEFGCVLPLVAIAFAVYFWTGRKKPLAERLEAVSEPAMIASK